jgi:uncharacterized protein YdcH (DUF465 family)
MNFDNLTDEEIDTLQAAIEARIKTRGAPAGGDDQGAEDAKFAQIAEVLEALQEKIKLMDEEIDTLTDLVQHEIIDKISEGVEESRRTNGIKGLGDKYGEKFEPFRDFYSQMSGGADILEKLWEELEEARTGKESWGEEDESGKIEELLRGLTERRDGIKGVLGEKPEGKAIAVEKVTAAPVEKVEDLTEMVKNMKRSRIPGMPK